MAGLSVILGQMRCGTESIGRAVTAMHGVAWLGEKMRPENNQRFTFGELVERAEMDKVNDFHVAKLLFGHMDGNDIELMKRLGTSVVIALRRDKVAQARSWAVAKMTGDWMTPVHFHWGPRPTAVAIRPKVGFLEDRERRILENFPGTRRIYLEDWKANPGLLVDAVESITRTLRDGERENMIRFALSNFEGRTGLDQFPACPVSGTESPI